MNLEDFYSEVKTPSEFKFDMLTPSRTLFSMIPQDLDTYLYQIASNPRNSIKKKYELIDRAMSDYGFSKLARGTNRSVYRSLYADDIVVKVGVDKYGIQDARREYYNQTKLKPFCTKTFEVSPTGTIGLFEKVKPIIYKDEFKSIAEDVFDLLVKHILGKYILADIGASFFMNYGLRRGFGPVLLDYPYMYELDGAKLHCTNQVQVGNQRVRCDGLIDYDSTFDFLVCNKCGKKYLASDIAKIGNDNVITLNPDMIGECKKMAGRMLIGGEVAFDTEGQVSFSEGNAAIIKAIEENNFNSIQQFQQPKRQQQKKQQRPPQDVSVFNNRESNIDYNKRQILRVARDFLKHDMIDRYALTCMSYAILSFIKYTDKSIVFETDLLDIADDCVEEILNAFEQEENFRKPRTSCPQVKERWGSKNNNHTGNNNIKNGNSNGYNNNNRTTNTNRPNNQQNQHRQQNQQPRSQVYVPKDDNYRFSNQQTQQSSNVVSGEVYGDVPPMYPPKQGYEYDTSPIQDVVLQDDHYQTQYDQESKAVEAYNSIGQSNIDKLNEVAKSIDNINNQGPEYQDPLKKNKRGISTQTQETSTRSAF